MVSPIKNTLELLAIEKEDVVGTFRALGKAKLTSKLDGGDKICTLEDGDIVECFEQGTNEVCRGLSSGLCQTGVRISNISGTLRQAGKDRIRILSPANEMGWASLISSTDKKLFKTTRSGPAAPHPAAASPRPATFPPPLPSQREPPPHPLSFSTEATVGEMTPATARQVVGRVPPERRRLHVSPATDQRRLLRLDGEEGRDADELVRSRAALRSSCLVHGSSSGARAGISAGST